MDAFLKQKENDKIEEAVNRCMQEQGQGTKGGKQKSGDSKGKGQYENYSDDGNWWWTQDNWDWNEYDENSWWNVAAATAVDAERQSQELLQEQGRKAVEQVIPRRDSREGQAVSACTNVHSQGNVRLDVS